MSIMNLKFKYTTDSNPFYIEFMFEKLNESMLLNFVKKSIQVSKIHFEMSFPIFSGFSCFCWTWVQAVQRDRVHSAVMNTSKTVPTQTHVKFDFRDNQSTHLTILVEKLAATFCYKWS